MSRCRPRCKLLVAVYSAMSPIPVPRMQHSVRFAGISRGVRASLAIALALALAACGFHLQGAGTLPSAMARTYVDTQRPHSEFLQSLTEVLRQRGAELLDAPADGAAVLDITSD